MRKDEIVALIVDDDAQKIVALAEAFAKKGVTTVRIAETLDVFLKLMHVYSHRSKVVTTDPWSTTFKDGWAVLTCIEAQGKRNTLALTWTEVPTLDKTERARRRGAFELFPKTETGIEQIVSYADTTPIWHLLQWGQTVDDLTEVFNRRGFKEAVKEKLRLIKRIGSPENFCFLMTDVDYFKNINVHGHHVGDSALKMVARALRESVRYTDVVGRYAGDEFVIFTTGVDEAGVLAELWPKIKAAIAGLWLETDVGTRVEISLSLGVSQITLKDIQTHGVDEVVEGGIERADKAMMTVKKGR